MFESIFYRDKISDWDKFRYAYEGGREFINNYLYTYSERESTTAFNERLKLTYCPAHAKAAIDTVKDAIYQRMSSIVRSGSLTNYLKACKGENGGVDKTGNTMNYFMGVNVLPELLVLGKVGVYVDAPPNKPTTFADQNSFKPYIYVVKAENITAWNYDYNIEELNYAVIKETVFTYDKLFPEIATGYAQRYREIKRDLDGSILIKIYSDKEKLIDEYTLFGVKFPLIVAELNQSLMQNIADCQIALLNLSSSDISYCLKSNFPFYTEQYDIQAEFANKKMKQLNDDGEVEDSDSDEEIRVGNVQGRKYPKNMERPAFIHPSSEPLIASMKKQDSIKEEIRQLINLSVQNMRTRQESAESKEQNEKGLEAGLSAIGLELNKIENKIVELWANYLNEKNDVIVSYPTNYSLVSEADKVKESLASIDLAKNIPSQTYRKEVLKQIAYVTLGDKINTATMSDIEKDIDKSKNVFVLPSELTSDIENGLVSTETASNLRGYPEGEVEKAKKDHAERIARIQMAQTSGMPAARGVMDLDVNGKQGAKFEKDEVNND